MTKPRVRTKVIKPELLQLADDLEWFFPLRLPTRLHWREVAEMEIEWDELPHQDLSGFLAEGLVAPRAERTLYALLRLAQGLGRWQDSRSISTSMRGCGRKPDISSGIGPSTASEFQRLTPFPSVQACRLRKC